MNDNELTAIIQSRFNEQLASQNICISTNLQTAIRDLLDNVEDFVALCKGELPNQYSEIILREIAKSFEEVYLRSID